ncbi:MAG: Imm27 family immunity protein [Gemmatimonadota bacterium]|nr:Imm27 family immunity protein [Gemmatimonadota bacterium]
MTSHAFEVLSPEEEQLTGHWVDTPSGPHGDAVDQRIFWLVTERLVALGSADGGWDWLFRDPLDGRLWELTHPKGSLHGRGPRQLTLITPHAAAMKYDLSVQ